jgi:hypothetical protein
MVQIGVNCAWVVAVVASAASATPSD